MFKYLIQRLLLFIPTFFGITLICFLVINLTPGGPIERKIAKMRFSNNVSFNNSSSNAKNHSVSEELVEVLKKQYGLDKPVFTRYFIWLKNVVKMDFGESFVHELPTVEVIISKFPVSLQFGIISFFLVYLISIPLGLYKAFKDQSNFDYLSSFVLIIAYSTPILVLGILLKTYLTGGNFLDLFPPGDLYSDDYFQKDFFGKIKDRIYHFILPLICYVSASFTLLTILMKNSLLECIRSDYILTARAKGLSNKSIILKHAFKNAIIPIVTGLGSFVQFFFAGSLIIEKMFNLDGIGLLGYESAVERDLPVLLALIFFQSLLSLLGRLISDIGLMLVDPRITFSK